jgi:hypothetical protein
MLKFVMAQDEVSAMKWSSALVKLFLGVVIAIALLVSGSVALALIFINRAATPPPKPIFANDTAAVKKEAKGSTSSVAAESKVAAKPSAKPSPSESAASPLASGTYAARVTWEQGLSVRSEPSLEAERIGSVDYNQQVIVLEESQDKKWERIRLEDDELEGWVKSGNTERVKSE